MRATFSISLGFSVSLVGGGEDLHLRKQRRILSTKPKYKSSIPTACPPANIPLISIMCLPIGARA